MLFTDFVPKADLIQLYQAAALFVFPSYYEGFRLPPLETMTCGIPVIASNASILPEVLDDAEILFHSHAPDELCHQMRRVLTDEELRQTMEQKGLERTRILLGSHSQKNSTGL
jgi:glycosyltransferase involved in cell wall biosynthesis